MVLSLSGTSAGHGTMAEAEAAGLYHPNCRHSESIYFPEIWGEPNEEGRVKHATKTGREAPLESTDAPSAKPAQYVDNFDEFQPLALTQQERAVLKDLQNETRITGHEYGAAIIDGQVYKFTSNQPYRVSVPPNVQMRINLAPDRSVSVMHSYPSENLPSRADFAQLTNGSIGKMSVVCYNNDAYSVHVGDGKTPTRAEYQRQSMIIDTEVRTNASYIPGFINMTLEEQNYALTRETANQIAHYYNWTMEGGKLE